ncbi:hypothetical protein KKA33_01695 [Patescibacteria group bacterium]|nr:hypothetical protein [Patescibacteria group bacterium]
MSVKKPDKFKGEKPQNPTIDRRTLLRLAVATAVLKVVSPFGEAKAEVPPCQLDISCQREMDRYRTPAEFGPEELKRLQNCQETLYRFYLNPSFLLYIERTEKQEKVDKALELAIRHPDELHYRQVTSGVFTITPRDDAKNIPAHFSVRIQFGQLVEINGVELNPLGWLDWEKFEKTVPEVNRKIFANRRNQRRDKKDRDQDIYDMYRIKLPHRLAKLIQLRGDLNPEAENAAVNSGYGRFLSLLEQHPQSREELNKNLQIIREGGEPEKTMQFHVVTNKYNPGVFVIKVPTYRSFEPILGVSEEGYLMEAVGHNEGFVIWALPDGYKNAIAERQKQR